jgi:nitrite reductase (NADH) small subunit
MAADWIDIGSIDDVPLRGSRLITTPRGDIAVFKAFDGRIFALWDQCPHRGGPLSQGIVNGYSVTCPLHNWVIGLETGEVNGPDQGCARKVAVKVEGARVLMSADALHLVAA